MSKKLKKDIKEFTDSLIKEIINLESINGKSADIRRITLNEVVDHLQSLLDAQQYRDFNEDNRTTAKERIEEIRNKVRKKNYTEQRAEDIANEYNVNKVLEEYYKLGSSNAYGHIMYMLDQDFDKKDIKKFIIDGTKDDVQFRCDVFGVWGELMDKII